MTWKLQSGQEKKHAKNRHCLFTLCSTQPKRSHVVAGLGEAGGGLEAVFSPLLQLKEEIVLLTSESCFLSLATQMNYFHRLLSENEFDVLV